METANKNDKIKKEERKIKANQRAWEAVGAERCLGVRFLGALKDKGKKSFNQNRRAGKLLIQMTVCLVHKPENSEDLWYLQIWQKYELQDILRIF